ncbi:Tas retrotransposon peptidase A16, partial [Ostertagia ostertagi]
MAVQLISYKRQLTQTTNKLDTVVQRFKEEELESLRVTEDLSPIDYQDAHRRLEEGIGAIRVCTSRIESLLGDYATTLDALQEPSKKEYDDYDEYAKKAEEGLAKAIDYVVTFAPSEAQGTRYTKTSRRKVLEKKHALPTDNRFEMNTLMNFLEEVISSEETVLLFTGGNLEFQKQTQRTERKGNRPFNACMYCQGNHRPAACDTYKTPQERSRYLREHKLHPTTRRNQPLSQGSSTAKKAQQAPKPTRNVNQVCTRDDVEQIAMIREQQRPHESGQSLEPIMNTTICELQSAQRDRKLECTFLPTGELTVFDPTSGGLRKVAVLLDTGAELSFIDSSLADELGLATVENTKLRLHTFGSNNIQEEPSRRVQLDTWDEDGQPLRLSLHTHKILTKALATPPILKDDIDYIRSLKIPLR